MFAQTSNVKLYYEIHGNGAPLIMLHGNGESSDIFKEAVSVLEKEFTVYTIDSRGHGKSSPASELHYDDMADDIYEFITLLNIEKPVVYGFSDGGIIALLLAIKHQNILSKIIISGPNTNPKGINASLLTMFKIIYFFTRSDKIRLMLKEPDISNDMLKEIEIPVFITGGEKDMIKISHLKEIADNIKNSKLTVFDKENHGSYIVNSTKIADYIINALKN